ncbi:MAG: hypothetical protein J5979_03920 [Lachnospiraceae bacterium]|nr:hypothetical protein [Lachnospiraceae bacterium]
MVTDFDELNIVSTKKKSKTQQISIYEYFDEMAISEEEKKKRIDLANLLLADMLFIFALAKRMSDKKFLLEKLIERYTASILGYVNPDKKMETHIQKISKSILDVTLSHLEDDYYTSVGRATNIAENEANSIMNNQEYVEAVKNGCIKKEWVSFGDERVRKDHSEVDGVIVAIDKPFHVGKDMMMFPKDDSFGAGAEQIIGCRCTVRYFGNKKDPLTSNGLSHKMDLQLFAERDIKNQESNSLKRAIRKYEKRIEEHKMYIENPISHCPDWNKKSMESQEGLMRHWNKEIRNFEESIENRVKELKRRGDYDE